MTKEQLAYNLAMEIFNNKANNIITNNALLKVAMYYDLIMKSFDENYSEENKAIIDRFLSALPKLSQ